MIKLQGKYSVATIMADSGEESAISQIYKMLNNPSITNPVVIMPDFHAGKGSVIGFTMEVGDYVIPNIVGVDIGCGMLSCKVERPNFSLEEIDNRIRKVVPLGFNIHKTPIVKYKNDDLESLSGIDHNTLECSIGTLGGGNHFIEYGIDSFGEYWITIHSGSRNFGKRLAEYYQKKAVEFCKNDNIEKDMEFLPTDDYLESMQIAQEYAYLNRQVILQSITNELKIKPLDTISCVHNYINSKDKIIRKGAIKAAEGVRIVIPFNRRDGIWIMSGKGNRDWNFSAPHGAGRTMSRGEAKRSITQDFVDKEMKESGVYSSYNPIDESPDVYKSVDSVTKYIGETAELLFTIKPLLNVKG